MGKGCLFSWIGAICFDVFLFQNCMQYRFCLNFLYLLRSLNKRIL